MMACKLYSFKNGLTFKEPLEKAGGQLVEKKFKELKMSLRKVSSLTGIPKGVIKTFYKGCTLLSYQQLCKILDLAQIDFNEYIDVCNQADKNTDEDEFIDELING